MVCGLTFVPNLLASTKAGTAFRPLFFYLKKGSVIPCENRMIFEATAELRFKYYIILKQFSSSTKYLANGLFEV